MQQSFSPDHIEEKYKFIFYEARDGIVLTDCETGNIVDCNPEFERQTGRSLNILKTMGIWELRPADKVKDAKLKFEEIRRLGYGGSDELEYQRPNGEIVPIEFMAKTVSLGDECYILSITRDISKRRQLEHQLANYHEHLEELVQTRTDQLRRQAKLLLDLNDHLQQEIAERTKAEGELAKLYEKYQFFFHKCNDGMGIIDCSTWPIKPGKHMEVNDILCKMLGYSREELLELSPTDITAPEYLPQHLVRVATLSPGLKLLFESLYITKTGERFPMEVTIHLCELDGKLSALTVYRDIRQRKTMELELEHHYEEEKSLRQNLEDRIHRNIEFIRGVIHELKTPLTYMMGTSEMLARELADSERLSRFAQNICHGTRRLNSRISELIDLAKGEAGILQIKAKSVRLPQLLRDIIDSRFSEAEANHIGLRLEAISVPDIIWADEDRLTQVIDNLLNNAIRYTLPGGIITLSCRTANSAVEIEVADTGCGIGEQEQASIFEPYSADRQNKDTLGGLGIGLPLAKMLVELHGGKISLRSEIGKGTRVFFAMPLDKPRPGEP
ncbi:PAS domain S-box protein [Dehalogenimonas sp. 4OHTPN]|uniref:histidine kinase n=1 Tax=Dehalogenimonas sp. 4OHTPN TaxID=3166643 RepID=A0AAU8G8L1_9CHLR